MSEKVYALLNVLADGELHSGEKLGSAVAVGRAAVWKILKSAEDFGIEVSRVKGRGYQILGGLDLLNKNDINAEFDEKTSMFIQSFDIFNSISSTNQYLLDQLRSHPERIPSLCVAEHQTSGRGRRGRDWYSPYARNLYLSISAPFEKGIKSTEGLSLAVGVVIAQMLSKAYELDIQLKWPNDLFYRGKKLGGVLIELMGDINGLCKVVVGVGINVAMADIPENAISQEWACLAQASHFKDSRSQFAAKVIQALSMLLYEYEEKTFLSFQEEWNHFNYLKNKNVHVLASLESFDGVVRGVDSTGALLIETRSGDRVITGGEITLRELS